MVLPKSGMEEKQRELSFGFNRSSCLVKQLRSLQAQHFADISAGRQNFRIDKIKVNCTICRMSEDRAMLHSRVAA
jgi:hypothetical protein